jgi:hypothetical protein
MRRRRTYVRVGSAVEAVPAEEGDEAAEAQPRRGPPRRRRHRREKKGNGRVVGFPNQRGLLPIYRWAFPSNILGRNRIGLSEFKKKGGLF